MFMNSFSIFGLTLLAVICAACSSPTRQAPIEDRGFRGLNSTIAPAPSANVAPTVTIPVPNTAVLPQSEKPGFHTVKPGETLYSIALAYGQDFRQVAVWNQLADAGVIKVGQVLRVTTPDNIAAAPAGVQTAPVKMQENIESRALANAPGSAPINPATTSAPVLMPAAPKPTPDTLSGIEWAWPVNGAVLERFDETRNKGIDIAGKAGDAVLASADGKVVYVGNGLRGYGNLVIVKHNDDFISAYAHNSKLLVQLHEAVRRGQKIAEMGSSDADRSKLHFEIRREGKPDDPLKYLPERK